MVIGIIGENCSGKSTLAGRVRDAVGAEIVTGKDYLRMAKSEAEARKLFQKKLKGRPIRTEPRSSARSQERIITKTTIPGCLRTLSRRRC